MRKLIYTTNAIEGFNRQLKKVTKAKSVFSTDDSLFKMLYLAMRTLQKSGQDAVRTGAVSMLNWSFSMVTEFRINIFLDN